jgi:tetratricopeptide (TPR) repeat protein
MSETVRQYTADRLEEGGENDTIQDRHLDSFLALAEEAETELNGPQQAAWLERLEAEHDNLRSALDWSLRARDVGTLGQYDIHTSTWRDLEKTVEIGTAGRAEYAAANVRHLAIRLAGSLARFWCVRGHLSEGRERISRALVGQDATSAARAKALSGAANLASNQGDYEGARVLHEESLAISREISDLRGVAVSLANLAHITYNQGDHSATRSLHEESLAISRELGDRLLVANSLSSLGNVASDIGSYSTARSLQEESLAIRRELGDRGGIAWSLYNLGSVNFHQDDYGAAWTLFGESLTISRELGDRFGIANALLGLGIVALNQGNYALARPFSEESLAIKRELGDLRGIAWNLNVLGNLDAVHGDHATALVLYSESLTISREMGDKRSVAFSLANLGNSACKQGDYAAACSFYAESLTIFRELGDRQGLAGVLEAFSTLATVTGAPLHAAYMWGAAERLREEIDEPIAPIEKEEYDSMVAEARNELGHEAFAAAWETGRNMTMEEACELALMDSED